MIQANSHGATFTDDFDEVLEASAASIPGAPAAARAWMVANKTASRRFISARHAVAELRQLQAEAVPLQVLLAAARSAQHAAATLGRLIVPKP
jgi:hypothetical protein